MKLTDLKKPRFCLFFLINPVINFLPEKIYFYLPKKNLS